MRPSAVVRAIGTALVAAAACSCGGPADDPEAAAVDELTGRLDVLVPALIEEFRVPGVAVALIVDGAPRWERGFGHADVQRSVPVTERTGFNIGSISKTVAAWGVMKLAEAGRVDLDAPVETYLTRWHLPESEFDESGVTLRRLLSHTAGLSLHGYPGFDPGQPLPTIEESLSGNTNGSGDVRLIAEPGTAWSYSGGGYTLAQLVVEEVTGESFASYLDRAIVQPLGLHHSGYDLTPELLARSSLAYDEWGEPTPGPRFTEQAAAGFQTTLEDLAVFAAAALAGPGGAPVGRDVLRPESVAAMLAAAPASEGRYGLGYVVDTLPDRRTTNGHGGSNRGWQALFLVVPATGDGIVVLTNGSNGWAVHRQIVCAWSEWTAGAPLADGCKKPIGLALIQTIADRGVAAAVERYRELRRTAPESYDFGEGELNRLGYALLQKGRIDEAIAIFALNVEFFPAAWNPYDSLGEAYVRAGNQELARVNYRRSLELNPDNANAVQMLERLGGS